MWVRYLCWGSDYKHVSQGLWDERGSWLIWVRYSTDIGIWFNWVKGFEQREVFDSPESSHLSWKMYMTHPSQVFKLRQVFELRAVFDSHESSRISWQRYLTHPSQVIKLRRVFDLYESGIWVERGIWLTRVRYSSWDRCLTHLSQVFAPTAHKSRDLSWEIYLTHLSQVFTSSWGIRAEIVIVVLTSVRYVSGVSVVKCVCPYSSSPNRVFPKCRTLATTFSSSCGKRGKQQEVGGSCARVVFGRECECVWL